LIEQEVVETRTEMHRIRMAARAGGSTHGIAGLSSHLQRLLDQRRELRPPDAPTADDEERKYKNAAAAALAMIRADVERYETAAAAAGVCVHCHLPLDRQPMTTTKDPTT
jgi:hypothetical protein